MASDYSSGDGSKPFARKVMDSSFGRKKKPKKKPSRLNQVAEAVDNGYKSRQRRSRVDEIARKALDESDNE